MAIVNGFSLVRTAYNGVTHAQDYNGNILNQMDFDETDIGIMYTDVPTKGIKTLYPRVGALIGWLSVLGLFGNGELKANPIHGEDLAAVCVDSIEKSVQEIKVGGPETLTHNEIATIAFEVLGVEPKITHIPDWVRVAILKIVRVFTGSKVYGPIEFFMTVMAMDMLAPKFGKHTLKEFFTELRDMNA
jgi:hypothetical protein